MASVFGHAIVAVAIGNTSGFLSKSIKFWLLAIFCCCIPDADVATFHFGIPYEHPFGHRGFTHSLFFALCLSLLITLLFYRSKSISNKKRIGIVIMFFLLTASHGVLDAMTTGGRGIAFFAPFDNTRHFLPWRVIEVSPMSAAKFFGEWGKRVIKSELMWLGIPSAAFILLTTLFRKARA